MLVTRTGGAGMDARGQRADADASQRPSNDGSEQAEVVVPGVDVVGAADEDNVDAGAVLVGAGRSQDRGHGGRREDEQREQQRERSCGSDLHGRLRAQRFHLLRFVSCAYIGVVFA